MKLTTTPKFIVAHYADFQVWSGNTGVGGPARVYYSKEEFTKAARHYGWGDTGPLEEVDYHGDKVPLFEVLRDTVYPKRVLR